MTAQQGDEDGGRPFLDEDFVRGGPAEPSADQRAREAARCSAAERASRLRDEQFEAARTVARSEAVGPTPDGWAMGDRTAHCTLQMHSDGPLLTPFSGEVRGADQEQLYPTGTCGSVAAAPIPCSAAHTWQVTGNVDVTGTSSRPASDAAWQALVGTRCSTLTLAFLGGSYPAGVQSSWIPLEASSWTAGERTVQCVAVHFPPDGGSALTSTGSLAGAGRH